MTVNEKILLAALCVVSVAAIVMLGYIIAEKRRIKKLKGHIDSFTFDSSPVLSLRDDELSQLENSVGDLENKLLLEHRNTQRAIKKNGEFIADVSHQLKTPLAGLRLYCEMDRAENPTARNEKQLELIAKTERLVFNLLRIEKIRSDTYIMEMKEQDLAVMLSECAEKFKILFPEKKITVSGTAVTRCDKEWFCEAVENLLKNSCEHTKTDGIVSVNIAQNEKSVIITVEDNGGGVPSGELSKLFTRFYHSENSSPTSAGLGLSIAKAIVEKHHGTIAAENTRSGLRMTVCLPILSGEIKI